MLPVFLVSLPFDRTGAWAHWIGAQWGRTIVRLVPGWRVQVEGTEQLRGGPFVVIANHQSQVDILVTFFLPLHFKWLSKRSVFHIPFLGWMMRMCRYVPVVRGDRRSAERSLEQCAEWIRRGVSVVFFPEGTRSPDGRLRSFKSGAFWVAAQTGAPVLPVAILGTRECLPKNSLRFGRGKRFRLVIGSPISSTGVKTSDAATFADQVRERFLAFREAADERPPAATGAS
jgi:1-acyl-sn-glycerol-3-phosphate acyltransferase